MLFKNSADLAKYISFAAINFPGISATLGWAEEQYLVRFMGQAQYDALNAAYNAEGSLTEPLKTLLEYARKIVAPAAVCSYLPKLDLDISDNGLRRNEEEGKKTAYAYQVRNYVETCMNEAETNIEKLLQYLETHIADFPLYAASDEYTDYKDVLIRTAKDFNKIFPTAAPYRNYWAMRTKMREVEPLIADQVDDTVYEDLKARQAGTLTKQEDWLLFLLKKSVAYMTVAMAIPYLNLRMNNDGLTVVNINNPSSIDNKDFGMAPDPHFLSNYITQATNDANKSIKQAQDFLKKNAASFPLYVVPQEAQRDDYDPNCHMGGMYMF